MPLKLRCLKCNQLKCNTHFCLINITVYEHHYVEILTHKYLHHKLVKLKFLQAHSKYVMTRLIFEWQYLCVRLSYLDGKFAEEKLFLFWETTHSLQAKWPFLGVFQGGSWKYLGEISSVHFLVAASGVLWRTQAMYSALNASLVCSKAGLEKHSSGKILRSCKEMGVLMF